MGSIAVVGGGVVGTSVAYHLRETPHDVTLFEKRSLGAGTTGKSIACFGWQLLDSDPLAPLVSRSWDVYKPLIDAGHLSFHENGLLRTARTDAFFDGLKDGVEAVREAGMRAEVLDSEEVSRFEVSPAAARAGATWYPSVGRLDPAEIVSQFAEAARSAGVDVETGVEVTDVTTDGTAVTGLETSEGAVDADVVVNAAGPWTRQVNAMAGVSLPVKHTLAPISVLETEENFDLPTVTLENGVYFTGERSAKVLAGHAPHASSDRDLWELADEFEVPDSKLGTGLGSVGERHRETIAENAPETIPKLSGAEISNEWRGIRCLTPDHRPLLGPTAVEGFHVATGMSGWGITLGPACGELLADSLAIGGVPDEMAPLDPLRFSDVTCS